MLYYWTGFVVVWTIVLGLTLIALFLAFEFLCAVIRVRRAGRRPWGEMNAAQIMNAIWLLMVDRIYVVGDDGIEIPRYPWQRTLDPPA